MLSTMGAAGLLCDAHIHVVARGNEGRLPIERARHHLSELGAERVVLVQAAADGDDPGSLVRALAQIGIPARGVVSFEAAASTPLDELAAAGVRSVRVSGLGGLRVTCEVIRSAAALAATANWHLAYYPMDADEWVALAPELRRVDVPVVIDHMALRTWHTAAGPDQPAFRLLLDLVTDGVWVKLSGAFRRGTPPEWDDVVPFVQMLVERGPGRAVWGSDWPYLAFDGPPPVPADLNHWLARALRDDADRQRVLVDNPRDLYGFESQNETPS